jgi:hypothetical protein
LSRRFHHLCRLKGNFLAAVSVDFHRRRDALLEGLLAQIKGEKQMTGSINQEDKPTALRRQTS